MEQLNKNILSISDLNNCCYQKIRDYNKNELIPTSEGNIKLPNQLYPTRYLNDDGDEDKQGFNIEFYYKGRWIRSCSIDFE